MNWIAAVCSRTSAKTHRLSSFDTQGASGRYPDRDKEALRVLGRLNHKLLFLIETSEMPSTSDFQFVPLANHLGAGLAADADPATPEFNPLVLLTGHWEGTGFNAIWRPIFGGGSDRFLMLNETIETIDFEQIDGAIANRGAMQNDLFMSGMHYLQKVSDAHTTPGGIHVEPGVWLAIPSTTSPPQGNTVARMASIPHGTAILAQGIAIENITGGPTISPSSISPFPFSSPASPTPFPEQFLGAESQFRSPKSKIPNVEQSWLDNPNSLLTAAIEKQKIVKTTVLDVSTNPQAPVIGGGIQNTAFLHGVPPPPAGSPPVTQPPIPPNADAAQVKSTFWIETLDDGSLQLQYSQTVLLNFNGLSWPHVSVATLKRIANPPAAAPHV